MNVGHGAVLASEKQGRKGEGRSMTGDARALKDIDRQWLTEKEKGKAWTG